MVKSSYGLRTEVHRLYRHINNWWWVSCPCTKWFLCTQGETRWGAHMTGLGCLFGVYKTGLHTLFSIAGW